MPQLTQPAPTDTTPPDDDPALQGEGNISAARRHRKSVEEFVEAGKVQPAADNAAPTDAAEAQELRDAEAEGRAHAKR
jgi:hypothetical protein